MKRILVLVAAVVTLLFWCASSPAYAGDGVGRFGKVDPDRLAGQPADIAPSAYQYRSDRPAEENPPETEFLFRAVGHRKADALCGLLWEEPRAVKRVELRWPEGAKPVPKPNEIVLRWLAFGRSASWWCRDKRTNLAVAADRPEVSSDGRTLAYSIEALTNETAPDNLVVCVKEETKPKQPYAVPMVRVLTVESWKPMNVEIEWGFRSGTEELNFDGRIEVYNAILGEVRALAGDPGTKITAANAWKSSKTGESRRGIAVGLLYLGTSQNTPVWPGQARLETANRTVVTVRTTSGSFSFLPADLETGPILAPEYGFFVRAVNGRKGPSGVRGLLNAKMNAIAGSPAARGWGSDRTPWFGVHTGREPVRIQSFTLPGRSVAMHPGPDRRVAVGWRSPIRGRVGIKAKVADGDVTGGNGIQWSVTRDGKGIRRVLANGSLDRGGSQSIPSGTDAARLTNVAVEPGDLVSLVVGAKAGNHTCDTTVVELVITEAGGKARKWNLTRDVVETIHAGNPQADAFGNPAVWHFYAPEGGAEPVVPASSATCAREFERELRARKLKTIRRRVREHEEQTWEQAVRAMHPRRDLPPYPKPEYEPAVQIEVPCPPLTDAWRVGAWHLLRGAKQDSNGRWRFKDPPYVTLGAETQQILRTLDLMGKHKEVRDGLEMWLERVEKPVPVPEGLFTEAKGCFAGLDWDYAVPNGAGLLQLAMLDHYALTADKGWLTRAVPKLKANSEWILRQRRGFTEGVPSRQRLWCYGLQPPHNNWDNHVWRPWYESDAVFCAAVWRFAQVIADIDPQSGKRLLTEARQYARDILAAVERSLILSPVIRVRDGTYRSFIPPAPYIRGPASRFMPAHFGATGHTPGLYADAVRGGQRLVELPGLLAPADPRVQGYLDVLEDRLLLEHSRLPHRTKDYDPEKHWFSHAGWYYQCGLERTANIHIALDDVPVFLRSLLNQYAVHVVPGPYTFREHTSHHPVMDKPFEEAAFLERFRQMLVMEDGDSLWLARATPRAWLEQGKKICVKNSPTHFGTLSYEILSDVANGKVTATVEMPSRKPPGAVLLRFRHPSAAPIRSVTVNGKPWTDFDEQKETIRIEGLKATVSVRARY